MTLLHFHGPEQGRVVRAGRYLERLQAEGLMSAQLRPVIPLRSSAYLEENDP